MKTRSGLIALAAAAAVAAGCASNAPRGDAPSYPSGTYGSAPGTTSAPVVARYGTVESVRELQRDGQGNWIPGAVIGGVIGGVLGNQVGSGRGNDVATAAGAIGGAVVGAQVGRNRGGVERAYEVVVRLDDGNRVTLQQPDVSDLQPGMRVLVDDGVARRL